MTSVVGISFWGMKWLSSFKDKDLYWPSHPNSKSSHWGKACTTTSIRKESGH